MQSARMLGYGLPYVNRAWQGISLVAVSLIEMAKRNGTRFD